MAKSEAKTISREVNSVYIGMKNLDESWSITSADIKLLWIGISQKALVRLRKIAKAEAKILGPKEG